MEEKSVADGDGTAQLKRAANGEVWLGDLPAPLGDLGRGLSSLGEMLWRVDCGVPERDAICGSGGADVSTFSSLRCGGVGFGANMGGGVLTLILLG